MSFRSAFFLEIFIFDAPVFAFEDVRYLPEVGAQSLNDSGVFVEEVENGDICLFCMIDEILKNWQGKFSFCTFLEHFV